MNERERDPFFMKHHVYCLVTSTCEQTAQSCYMAVERARVKPATHDH